MNSRIQARDQNSMQAEKYVHLFFTFSLGAGGRDLSGNKRTSEQSFDQELTKSNLAIAFSCDCKVDSVNGGKANNWKKGKPVRVIRSEKFAKHSTFAPPEGCRYDGTYKVGFHCSQTAIVNHLVSLSIPV
jgi:hypothetical protein